MRGEELRRERTRLGIAADRIAVAANTTEAEVHSWETANTRVPHAASFGINAFLYAAECEQVLKQSGLPECPWAKAFAERPFPTETQDILRMGEEFDAHKRECSVCQARDAYVDKHVKRRGGLFNLGGAMAFVVRLPSPLKEMAQGSLLIFLYGIIGVPVAVIAAIVNRDPRYLGMIGALVAASVVGGSSGGAVYWLTGGMRRWNVVGYYVSWIATVEAYVFGIAGLVLAANRVPAFASFVGSLVEGWTGTEASVVCGSMGLLFGLVAGAAAKSTKGEVPKPRTAAQRRWDWVATLAILLLAVARFYFRNPVPTPPTLRPNALSPIPELQTFVRQHPRDAQARFDLGKALGRANRQADAAVEFEEAVRLVPTYAGSHSLLALSLAERRPSPDLVMALREAYEGERLDSTSAYSWATIGEVEVLSRHYFQANLAYKQVERLDSTFLRRYPSARRFQEVARLAVP